MEYNYSDLTNELGQNFIEYAAAVNSDRAIPDATSGLKPVARRILYGAYTHGRSSAKPHVKCARIVGDVMGELHPHGDSSIYGALVRLAQDWVMRYPLIDFHGNVGNIGGDGPAASRYTEARLSKISEEGLLEGLKKNNVDFIPNYDETTEEPITLPSIFPNLLCNPNTGIGVAMACNWLPHNLEEVQTAILQYVNGEEPNLPGPDFPTGGLIINGKDLPEIIKNGRGSVRVRAKYKVEKNNIIFYEIPYGETTEGLLAEIGKLCDEKEIEGISEIRDESNKKGLRLVVQCEKSVSPDTIAMKLFAKSNLQTSISYNQVALVDKTPTELGLKDCIRIYLEHNTKCIRREATFDLSKAQARLEIVKGLLKALEDIDNIIKLIKASENAAAAKTALINKYDFSENQAKAILDMKLAKLAHLEKIELEKEENDLNNSITNLNALIASTELQEKEVLNRLDIIVKKYGDARRTEITNISLDTKEKEIAAVAPEDVVVILSQTGEVKRIPKNSFKIQRRNGKGVKTESDAILSCISTNTIDNLLVFTNIGKMYRLLVDNIPIGTNTSRGISINTLIPGMDSMEKVIAATSLDRNCPEKYIIFVTKNGLIKKTELAEYKSVKRNSGIIAIKLKDDDSIANVAFMNEEDLILITREGMSIHFSTKDIAPIGRATAGVKSIKLIDGDYVLAGIPIKFNDMCIATFTEKGYGRQNPISEFPIQGRSGRGVIVHKASPTTGKLVGAVGIIKDDNLLIVGKPNSICIASSDIPVLTRGSLGNLMLKNNITSIVKL